MRKYSRIFLLSVILIIIGFMGIGCLGHSAPEPVDIPPGQPESYEFNIPQNNVTNSTTIFLYSNKTVRVVTSIVNTSSLKIILEDISAEFKSEKGPGIKDLVVIGNISHNNQSDHSGLNDFSNISYNTTYVKSARKKMINIEFAQPITGFVAYSYSGKYGQFYHSLSRNETINVVLPPDHNTGNIILGSTKPTRPDEILKDNNGRIRLIWKHPYPEQKFIFVKYYKSSLPTILGILALILGIGFLVTAFYFKNEIRKLRLKREAIESDMRKKR